MSSIALDQQSQFNVTAFGNQTNMSQAASPYNAFENPLSTFSCSENNQLSVATRPR